VLERGNCTREDRGACPKVSKQRASGEPSCCSRLVHGNAVNATPCTLDVLVGRNILAGPTRKRDALRVMLRVCPAQQHSKPISRGKVAWEFCERNTNKRSFTTHKLSIRSFIHSDHKPSSKAILYLVSRKRDLPNPPMDVVENTMVNPRMQC